MPVLINSVATTKLQELITSFSVHSGGHLPDFPSFSLFVSLVYESPLPTPTFLQCVTNTLLRVPWSLSDLPHKQNEERAMRICRHVHVSWDRTISIHRITWNVEFRSKAFRTRQRAQFSFRHVQFTRYTSIYLDVHVLMDFILAAYEYL